MSVGNRIPVLWGWWSGTSREVGSLISGNYRVVRYPDEIRFTVLKMETILEYITNEYGNRWGFSLESGLEIF